MNVKDSPNSLKNLSASLFEDTILQFLETIGLIILMKSLLFLLIGFKFTISPYIRSIFPTIKSEIWISISLEDMNFIFLIVI